jgi:hypothetical protein
MTYGRYSRTERVKRWVRLHATGNRQRARNWMNRRAIQRGRSPLPDRVTRAVGSRTPVYRNRTNPATGRPRWTDRSDGDLARWRRDQFRDQQYRQAMQPRTRGSR